MKRMRKFEQALSMGDPSSQARGGVRMPKEIVAVGTREIQDVLGMYPVRRSSGKEECCMARSCVDGQFS
jgi:hypothetical protein